MLKRRGCYVFLNKNCFSTNGENQSKGRHEISMPFFIHSLLQAYASLWFAVKLYNVYVAIQNDFHAKLPGICAWENFQKQQIPDTSSASLPRGSSTLYTTRIKAITSKSFFKRGFLILSYFLKPLRTRSIHLKTWRWWAQCVYFWGSGFHQTALLFSEMLEWRK